MAQSVGNLLQAGFCQLQTVVLGIGSVHPLQILTVLLQDKRRFCHSRIGHGTQYLIDFRTVHSQQMPACLPDGRKGLF